MWMLEEVGEPYEIELLSLKNGDQHKPEYLAVNPMGKVPAIDDNGTIVSEVSAICCYLADALPEGRLGAGCDRQTARTVSQMAVLRAKLRRAGDHRQGHEPATCAAIDRRMGRL